MRNGSWSTRGQAHKVRGITLIELMIVVVIVGILAAIAYPSYQNQVRESRRADGKAALLQAAQQLERCYTRFASYNNAGCAIGLPITSGEGFYVVSAVGAIGAASFTLQAVPQNDQANDAECGTLTLTDTGQQGADGDVNACW